MKRKIIFSLSAIIVIAISGVWYFRSRVIAPNQNSIWVETVTIKESSLPIKAMAIGTLVARSVEITPEIPGHIRNIHFRDGSFVKQDEPLFQLDDAVYKAKYESAKAQLAYSQNDLKRKKLLGKQGAIAQQAIDQAEADFKEKTAIADENKVMLNKMQLRAPFAGMLGKSKINPGDYVTTGEDLVTLTDTKHLRIEYNVPEKFLPLLKTGQQVEITTATYPDKIFTGKVSYISPTISAENRSLAIYADVVNEKNELAAGMFVNVVQSLGRDEKVVMVPARSLIPMLDGQQVFKVVDGKAYSATVLTGRRDMENVQITKGLSIGDVVITDGHIKVKNGVPVKVKG